MRSIKIFLPLLILFFAGNLYSQSGWGPGSKYNQLYDINTVETISGQVISVDQISHDNSKSNGVHLTVNTGQENITVHLGPAWYIDNQEIQIVKDDIISVTGSKVVYNGDMIIIAKYVIKGNDELLLRDDNGFPLWSGWRNKN